MKLTLHQDVSLFESLRGEWNDLLKRSVTDTIFLTWEWQATWWETYRAGDLFVVTLRDDDDHLLGIAPWFVHTIDGERVLRTIGCVDVTDYVDVIADGGCYGYIAGQFAQFLADHRHHFDRINLCNIPEASPTYTEFPIALQRVGFETEVVLQEVCPIIQLPTSWDEYLAALDKKERHEIRRKLRRAENEAQVRHYFVGNEHDFERECDRFLTLMAASQPSKAEFLRDPHNLAFFKAILKTTHDNGWLKLSFLTFDDKPVAAYCDFDYNNSILVYNSGLLLDAYSHLSGGIVLLAYNIQHAIEQGRTVFDFLRGNETYKYRMGGVDTRVFKLRAKWRGG